MPNTKTTDETLRDPVDGSELVRLATPGANWKAPLSQIFTDLGSAQTGFSAFATPSDAQAGFIPDSSNFVSTAGNRTPGDGGAANWQRVSSLPSLYVGDGTTTPLVPPSFTSGGLPILCFATTRATYTLYSGVTGPITQPIIAGSLAFLTITQWELGLPATISDSAGNVYTLAVNTDNAPGFSMAAIYYCANPVFAPIGTTIIVPFGNHAINVYTVPGFTGAVLDQTASFGLFAPPTTGVSITTAALTGSPSLVIATGWTGGNPANTSVSSAYVYPAGWTDLEPPITYNSPTACIVTDNTSPVTFNPTWPVFATGQFAVMATFKTFPRPALDASFWELLPTSPLHTAACGIDPAAPDNALPFQNFSRYLATTASASGGIQGGIGTPAGTMTISIGNPAIITAAPANFINHGLHNGQAISFSTTGALPAPLVPGQIYYIQYGTVTPTTFQISTTSIFGGVESTVAKGTPISTLGGSQSGVHTYITYGQSWTDFVLDPGVYSASNNQAPGIGAGLQKWRLYGAGARMQTNTYFWGGQLFDVNADTAGTTFLYQAQFQSSNEVHNSGNFPDYVILNTPALAANFWVNSWVALTCLEQQASANGNWNPAIFEYAKVKSVDTITGIITFWDRLQNNYRSTYPKFAALALGWVGSICGQASIVQLNDNFDQEIEVHGLNLYCVTELTVGGVYSLRFVDCDFWGWAFDSGPSPVMVRKYTVERCRFHNCIPEIDKMIDEVNYIDCDFDMSSYPRFQSASINKAIFDRCKMMGGMSGTPKDITIRDSFMAGTLTYGPVYGSTQRMTLINTHIERILSNDQATEVLQIGIGGLTFVNGTIKIASGTTTIYGLWDGPTSPSVCPAPWAQPGAKILIETSGGVTTSGTVDPTARGITTAPVTCFTVLDVYTDGAGAFCIDTDMQALPNTGFTVTGTIAGGVLTVTATNPANAFLLRGTVLTGGTLPANTAVTGDNGGMPGLATGTFGLSGLPPNNAVPTAYTASIPMNYLPHPCPRLTTINCTGGRWVADQAGAPPDIPMFSYFKRAFAGTGFSTAFHDKDINISGNLLTWTINVLRPYTGANASDVCNIYIGGWAVSGGITYPTFIQQTIDLKTTGLRTITAAGTTGSVGADSIAAIPFWISGQHVVVVTGADPADTMANMPFFIMQAQTDQQTGFASIVANTETGARPAGTLETFADTTTMTAQPQ